MNEMIVLVVLLALIGDAWASPSNNEFVDYYQVLGVDRNAKTSVIKAAFRTLALKMHPDKAGHSDEATEAYVTLNDAYATLRDAEARASYDEELQYFEKYGRMRHMLRYRVYPRTNVWVVAIGFLVITNAIHYYLLVADHKYHLKMVRFTPTYQKAHRKLVKDSKIKKKRISEEEAHEILAKELTIKNSGPPYIPQLWLYRLLVGTATAPYRIFMFFYTYKERREEQRKAQEEFLEEYKNMTKSQKSLYRKRWAKSRRGH